jgi:hypothetical protein
LREAHLQEDKGMSTKFTPHNVEEFLDEYEQLCRKHNLMVFSDGESVEVDEADENLWGIREHTEAWWKYSDEMAKKREAKWSV